MSKWEIIAEDGSTFTSCTYADEYKASRRPTCGCDACAQKWENKIREIEREKIAREFEEEAEEFVGYAWVAEWAAQFVRKWRKRK